MIAESLKLNIYKQRTWTHKHTLALAWVHGHGYMAKCIYTYPGGLIEKKGIKTLPNRQRRVQFVWLPSGLKLWFPAVAPTDLESSPDLLLDQRRETMLALPENIIPLTKIKSFQRLQNATLIYVSQKDVFWSLLSNSLSTDEQNCDATGTWCCVFCHLPLNIYNLSNKKPVCFHFLSHLLYLFSARFWAHLEPNKMLVGGVVDKLSHYS